MDWEVVTIKRRVGEKYEVEWMATIMQQEAIDYWADLGYGVISRRAIEFEADVKISSFQTNSKRTLIQTLHLSL